MIIIISEALLKSGDFKIKHLRVNTATAIILKMPPT